MSMPKQTFMPRRGFPTPRRGFPTPRRTQKVLQQILPSCSGSAFMSLGSSFACFFLHVLQNITEWEISVISMNRV